MSSLDSQLMKRMNEIPEGVSEGLLLQVFSRGKKCADLRWGKTYPLYDLASLTKILFTTTWYMKQVDAGLVTLEKQIKDYLPWFTSNAQVRSLLNHSVGLEWWRPFYKSIPLTLQTEERWLSLIGDLRRHFKKPEPKRAVYSDLDFFLLGEIAQALGQKNLATLWQELVTQHPKTFSGLHFRPLGVSLTHLPRKENYAPTERCPWRKKIIQAEVHDENAWALGGIAPHAGLFGSIDDVGRYFLSLREKFYSGLGDYPSSQKTLRRFLARSLPENKGDWALGFMMPTKGRASCGDFFSLDSVGHTGFTGTSLWWDIKKDLGVVILSNRTYPTRENKKFVELRPQIHNWVVNEWEKK